MPCLAYFLLQNISKSPGLIPADLSLRQVLLKSIFNMKFIWRKGEQWPRLKSRFNFFSSVSERTYKPCTRYREELVTESTPAQLSTPLHTDSHDYFCKPLCPTIPPPSPASPSRTPSSSIGSLLYTVPTVLCIGTGCVQWLFSIF